MPTKTSSQKPLGGLFAQVQNKEIAMPLTHTEVLAKVAGNLSRVEVTQQFENPFSEPLEAIYVFPLPDEAAVDSMEIKIGDRIIKGEIKKREEAREIYEQAKQQGRTAGLLEQERDNIFTQSLANIQPGERIEVIIRYTNSLQFEGGDYEFVFPMVVGPRYIPGTPIDETGDTDRVPDASGITPPVVPPEMRSGHDISVTVEIDAGMPISDVGSTSHKIVCNNSDNITQIQLAQEDNIPNKDLILRYRFATDNTRATVLTQADNRGGHFAVYFIPALEYKLNEIVPKDVVFLMDTSGSQAGYPLLQSQALMRLFIQGLNPEDTFTIVDFANTAQQLSETPLPNTEKNRQKAIAYVNQLTARGGTELLNGIRAVLNFPAAQEGRLRSIVLLTDGYIGNDNEILAEVQQHLQPGNRLYSFGVGSSVNRFVLNRLAEIGRGTCQVIRHDDWPDEVAEKFFRQINNPVLTNIQVSWDGTGDAPEIYPFVPPDLFAEQPLVLFGRQSDRTSGRLKVTGVAAGGNAYENAFEIQFEESGNVAIAQLWGRQRIKALMNEMFAYETKSGVEAVTETALKYQLLSQYTAFVAVSEEVRVDPEGNRISIEVPVEMPQGMSQQSIPGVSLASADASAPYSPPAGRRVSFMAPLPEGEPPPRLESPARSILSLGKAKSAPQANLMNQKRARECSPAPISHLVVIAIAGLDESATTQLTQRLENLAISAGFSGELTFELQVKKGRVISVTVDDEVSTVTEAVIIQGIQRILQAWRSPQNLTGTVRVTLEIKP